MSYFPSLPLEAINFIDLEPDQFVDELADIFSSKHFGCDFVLGDEGWVRTGLPWKVSSLF